MSEILSYFLLCQFAIWLVYEFKCLVEDEDSEISRNLHLKTNNTV